MSDLYLTYLTTFFIDVFYNHLYFQAIEYKDKKENNIKTITEAYKNILYIYKNAVAADIKTLIKGAYEDFINRSNQDNTIFTRWLNGLNENFIPSHLLEVIDQGKKNSVLATVFIDIIDRISFKLIGIQFLHIIIDIRTNDSVDLITKEIKDIIWFVKEETFQKFISSKSDNRGISFELAQKLKHENDTNREKIKKLDKLFVKIQQMINIKNEIILKKDLELQTAKSEADQYKTNVSILELKVKDLLTKHNELMEKINNNKKDKKDIGVDAIIGETIDNIKEQNDLMKNTANEIEEVKKQINIIEDYGKNDDNILQIVKTDDNNLDTEFDSYSTKSAMDMF